MPKLRDNLKGAVLKQAELEVSEVREVQPVPSDAKGVHETLANTESVPSRTDAT